MSVLLLLLVLYCIPWWLSGKESTWPMQEFDSCVRNIPGEGNCNPLQYSCHAAPTGCLPNPGSLPAHTPGPGSSSPTPLSPEMPSAFKVKCAGLGAASGPNPYCSCSQLWLHPGTTCILEILLLLSQPQRF